MLPAGVHYKAIDGIAEREDGSGITFWFLLTDGSLATLHIPFDELTQRAHAVSEPTHAPSDATIQ